ncbi:DNA mismatch repair protein mlh1 [Anaeramoeba flamelloides]|uniref:DNA mismatch repair protein mlh1 n=1 Tax=Anaeramoeba flamelloides TaxID=1746091 RepID=A0AAV8AGG0_9EUKA|nr:DNA mismatch repair protein mlh1 [Anaeramoeba flamelloides]
MTNKPRKIQKLSQNVINKIAAGEVVQRPSSALKELIENSLDAGSTQIQILLQKGGLKLLQIRDNGCGIGFNDLPLVCERFATSKLNTFEDLETIETFGFRGEALASISHVARISIITKTKDSNCAYQAFYSEGRLVTEEYHLGRTKQLPQKVVPRPSAGVNGTQIDIKDLFYNVQTRLKSFERSTREEFLKAVQVVSQYAVNNYKVAFSCKRVGDKAFKVNTTAKGDQLDTISAVYGNNISKELLKIEIDDQDLKFQMNGYISGINYHRIKGSHFILFFNNRLVENRAIKKSIEYTYSMYLPKRMKPFVLMSFKIPGENLDVNIHPTKREVKFLNEEQIIKSVQEMVKKRLEETGATQLFATTNLISLNQPTLSFDDHNNEPKNSLDKKKKQKPKQIEIGQKRKKPRIQSKYIRTDHSSQTLDSFFHQFSVHSSGNSRGFKVTPTKKQIDTDLINLAQNNENQKEEEEEEKEEEEKEIKIFMKKGVKSENSGSGDDDDDDDEDDDGIQSENVTPNSLENVINLKNSDRDISLIQEIETQKDNINEMEIENENDHKLNENDLETEKNNVSENSLEDNDIGITKKYTLGSLDFNPIGTKKQFENLLMETNSGNNKIKFNNNLNKYTETNSYSPSDSNSNSNLEIGNNQEINENTEKGDLKNSNLKIDQKKPKHIKKKKQKMVFKKIKLESVKQLKKSIIKFSIHELSEIIKHHVMVGLVECKHAVIQYKTKLLIANVYDLTKEFFYQRIIFQFGNFSQIKISEPIQIKKLLQIALDNHFESIQSETNNQTINKEAFQKGITKMEHFLISKRRLLLDYFTIGITQDGKLDSLPIITNGYIPDFYYLPIFLFKLVLNVNWKKEFNCLRGIAKELSEFYSIRPIYGKNLDLETQKYIQNFLFPEMKRKKFFAPKSFIKNNSIIEITKLEKLYKIFERC